MAKKSTTKSFQHYCNLRDADKVIQLRMKHGATGYGVYIMLLEMLCEQPTYTLKRDYETIGYKLQVKALLVSSVIEDFELFKFDEESDAFFSESLTEELSVKEERKRKMSQGGRNSTSKRWKKDKHTISTLQGSDKEVISTLQAPYKHLISTSQNNEDNAKQEIAISEQKDKHLISTLQENDKVVISTLQAPYNSERNEKETEKETFPHTPYKEKEKEKEKKDLEVEVVVENTREENFETENDVERLQNYINEIKQDRSWQEIVCMKYHISLSKLAQLFSGFMIDCQIQGTVKHDNLDAVRYHFANWLRIQLDQETKKKNDANKNNKNSKRRGYCVTATSAADYTERL